MCGGHGNHLPTGVMRPRLRWNSWPRPMQTPRRSTLETLMKMKMPRLKVSRPPPPHPSSHVTSCPPINYYLHVPSSPPSSPSPSPSTHRGPFGAADHSKCCLWLHPRGDPRGGLGGKTEAGHEEEGPVENGYR